MRVCCATLVFVLLGAAVAAAQGPAPNAPPGHWTRVRDPGDAALSEEQREAAERLEAIGYLSGYRPGARKGVTRYRRDAVSRRLNLYTSGHAPTAILIDLEGHELHRWQIDFATAFPDSPHVGDSSTLWWRRAYLFPNGDLLAIFEGHGLVKLDKDSKLLWAHGGGEHHDLDVQPDGSIVVLARTAHLVPRIDPDWPVLEDYVAVLGPDGRERRRISLLEAFEHSRFWNLARQRRQGDLFHTNTVQVLDESVGPPAFRAGNVLVAMNALSTVAVLDPRSQRIVWAHKGGDFGIHDPQILANGNLLLFDNVAYPDSSQVSEIDIESGRTVWSYRGTPQDPFLSTGLGAVARLANGNTLITESMAGRAFEVTPAGEIVWEFSNPYRGGDRGEFVATIFDMVPIPAGFPTDWLRPEPAGEAARSSGP